jgi:hypothetical protein
MLRTIKGRRNEATPAFAFYLLDYMNDQEVWGRDRKGLGMMTTAQFPANTWYTQRADFQESLGNKLNKRLFG